MDNVVSFGINGFLTFSIGVMLWLDSKRVVKLIKRNAGNSPEKQRRIDFLELISGMVFAFLGGISTLMAIIALL